MNLKKLLLFFIITFSIFGCVTEDDNKDDKIETFTVMTDNEIYNYATYGKYWSLKTIVDLVSRETIEVPIYSQDFNSRLYPYIHFSLDNLDNIEKRMIQISEENMSVAVDMRANWGIPYTYDRVFKGSKGTYRWEVYDRDTDELMSKYFFTEVTDSNKIDILNNAIPLP